MRFTAAYYLILIYLTVMFKPLIPVISDVCAHAFDEETHIATVHAKYGKNHLEKELADKQSDNSNNNKTALNATEQVPLHVSADEYTYDFSLTERNKCYPVLKVYQLTAPFLSHIAPPPKFF